jgi:hypothetical protein
MLTNYTHKETWSRKGKDFLVEVVRWERMTEEQCKKMRETIGDIGGRFIWNIYCYIYPNHRLFDAIKEESIFECPVNNLNSGCTFARWHINQKGEVMSKQYGCDYNHYDEEHFTYIEKPDDAYVVFNDAEDLFNELS